MTGGPELGGRPGPTAPPDLVEHFFRHEYGRLVALLTRKAGVRVNRAFAVGKAEGPGQGLALLEQEDSIRVENA